VIKQPAQNPLMTQYFRRSRRLEEIRAGRFVIVADDEGRENEVI